MYNPDSGASCSGIIEVRIHLKNRQSAGHHCIPKTALGGKLNGTDPIAFLRGWHTTAVPGKPNGFAVFWFGPVGGRHSTGGRNFRDIGSVLGIDPSLFNVPPPNLIGVGNMYVGGYT